MLFGLVFLNFKFKIVKNRGGEIVDIGTKIKELRILNGLTQEELADRSELSKGFISQLENDLTSPSISNVSISLRIFSFGSVSFL